MTDHRLSTRDLAARSDSTEADSSLETERPTARSSGAGTAREPAPETGGGVSDAAMRRDPAGDHPSDTRAGAEAREGHQPLFAPDQSERFTSRWRDIQTSFVDQPRDAVAEADALVADLMQRLAGSFSQERERLEAQWDRGDDVSTEELRVALTRYRSFFDRLLSV